MQVHKLSEVHSVVNTFIAELRDKNIQKDAMRFRKNVERIGEGLALELSKSLNYTEQEVETPLGVKKQHLLNEDIVICSVLRAGLSLHNGLLNYFDRAENAFISAFRKHDPDNPSKFEIIVEYVACPDLNNKVLLLVDPVLASGKSLELTYDLLKSHGKPKSVHLVSVIGAAPGIEHLNSIFDDDVHLWIGDIDPELDANAYIVPGLGDAGDLAFGPKLQH